MSHKFFSGVGALAPTLRAYFNWALAPEEHLASRQMRLRDRFYFRERHMLGERPLTILCVSSYEKGQEFIRTCKSMGCVVLLLTVEKLRHADWPFDCIDEVFTMPEDLPLQSLIYSVSYIARSHSIDRIVALDEFDMENVSALREHLRIPGMGLTTVRYFRDKLAMRAPAREAGILVPQFVHVLNYDNLLEFLSRLPNPLVLNPRSQASGIGMKKIHSPEA